MAIGLLMSMTLSAGPSVAKGINLADEVVIVEGVADIGSVGQSKARNAAIQNALSQAVAQALGTYIESTFSVKQKETLKNEKSEFLSKVEEQVTTKTKGLVSRYKVVSESRTESIPRKCSSKSSKGSSKDALAVTSSIVRGRQSKGTVLTGERYTDQFKKTKRIERPTID